MCAKDKHCADCRQPLTKGEIWVCDECSASHLIWCDPNGYMAWESPPTTEPTDKAPDEGLF
ncbi:hypothetical protein G9X52_00795 [Cronobacter sakazakii]|nr:hypothetical protein [Cronobacter sakazakii]EMD7610640.1 hypothetical protein [Cronobacter sakazakii]NCH92796.1 hypothetical protein [Cronobacter sakazakii]NHV91958.1 hypothetical protein [Cronobacter sakazakii]PQV66001.1 hypothetical protein CDT97_19265 [Cronobacter sakazakii]